MDNKKGSSFVFIIVAIILGVSLFKQFDFEKLEFEKPALAILYIIVFVASIYFIIKNARNK